MRESGEETRSVGGSTLIGAVQAPRSFSRGRVCSHEDCDTQLSIYNDGRYCSLHLPSVTPRMRGGKPSGLLKHSGSEQIESEGGTVIIPTDQPSVAGERTSPDSPIILVVSDD